MCCGVHSSCCVEGGKANTRGEEGGMSASLKSRRFWGQLKILATVGTAIKIDDDPWHNKNHFDDDFWPTCIYVRVVQTNQRLVEHVATVRHP